VDQVVFLGRREKGKKLTGRGCDDELNNIVKGKFQPQ